MAQKCKNKKFLHPADNNPKIEKKRFKTVSSLIEAFEEKLQAGEKELRPAHFLGDVDYNDTEKKKLVGILKVSALLVKDGMRYRQSISKQRKSTKNILEKN